MKHRKFYGNIWMPVGRKVDLKDVTFKIKDGASNELTVKIGEGNFNYTVTRNREYILDRGILDDVRDGDQVPVEVRFDFVWEYIVAESSGATPTVEEALDQTGAAAGWTSTDADTCRPYAVDLEILNAPTPSNCGDKETLTFSDFRHEGLDHDLRASTVACTGKCNITMPTSVRAPQ